MDEIQLFEHLKQVNVFTDLLQFDEKQSKAEIQSKHGNMFEKAYDIVIKLGLCPYLLNSEYDHYEGNINTCNLTKVTNMERYMQKTLILSKGKGGSSDITLKHRNTNKWVFISSKFYLDDSKKSIDNYDVEKILAVINENKHKYEKYEIYLLVHDKEKVKQILESSHESNKHIKDNIHQILDLSDLNTYIQGLKNIDIKTHSINKLSLTLRFHQDLITFKQMKMIDNNAKNLLLGAKARSGKTYCVGGLFIKYYQKYKILNALIITPAPTETISQFTDDLFRKFQDFTTINTIEIKKGTDLKKTQLKSNNIIIVSKQLLDDYVLDKKITSIQKLNLDFIVFDENHFHGTTQMSKNILESYISDKTVKLYLTATYAKPLHEWNIALDCQFYWDIEDEQFCKQRNIQRLVEKHGDDVLLFLNEQNKETKLKSYDNMPNLELMTIMMQ